MGKSWAPTLLECDGTVKGNDKVIAVHTMKVGNSFYDPASLTPEKELCHPLNREVLSLLITLL